MKKEMTIYGCAAGGVLAVGMFLGYFLGGKGEKTQYSATLGYLVMIAALTVVFVGIKRYRDRKLGGVIRFGTAALLGLGISTVASVIYVVAWEASLQMTDYGFVEDYPRHLIEAKEAKGASAAELEALEAEMEVFKRRYMNPLFRVPMTFLEIFPVGLLITLISAAILRNSKVLPAPGG